MRKATVVFVLALAALLAARIPAASAQKTLDNLMAAFNGESNAHAKYLAFAAKAEAEGYGPVASLFRAAARAEQVHYDHHAAVIKAMGGAPKATIETPVVKSTTENLQAAVAGETHEFTEMYPEFLAQADKDKNADARDTFELAKEAEAVHAQLFAGALKALDAWKGASKTFYVCLHCGNVKDAKPTDVCDICGHPASEFLAVK